MELPERWWLSSEIWELWENKQTRLQLCWSLTTSCGACDKTFLHLWYCQLPGLQGQNGIFRRFKSCEHLKQVLTPTWAEEVTMASYSGDLSEEEQAARAREERQQIVLRWVWVSWVSCSWWWRADCHSPTRYDQGREDGAVIDDWEDPKLEIYHTQDRYIAPTPPSPFPASSV